MHLVRAGGGFGRRLNSDYDIEVGKIARVVTEERAKAGLPSVPVKLLWSREDDMAHDQYRPGGFHYFKAGLDASGKLVAFRDFVASTNSVVPANEFPRGFVANFSVHSAPDHAVRYPDRRAAGAGHERRVVRDAVVHRRDRRRGREGSAAVPARSAGESCRRSRRGAFNAARARGVLEAVRDMSDWNNRSSLPKGTGKGVAFQFAHAGYVAYVVEAAVGADKKININKAWAAIDIGRQIVNPSESTNLVQGAFVEAMSHMMAWEITIDKGRVVQQQFQQLSAHAHGPGAVGDRGEVPADGLRSDRARRAGAAAGHSGDHQRDLRRHGRSHPIRAAQCGGVRLGLDTATGGLSRVGAGSESAPTQPTSVPAGTPAPDLVLTIQGANYEIANMDAMGCSGVAVRLTWRGNRTGQ